MNADIDELKKNPELTHVGPKASGTPGTLNGLYRAFQKFSSNRVQWKHLVLPTIQQCNKGFKLSEDLKKRSSAPALAQFFKANVQKDKILCTSLSTLLTDIADYESPLDAFYHGETAQKLAKELGGYMTASDLEDYESDMSSAICSEIDVDTKVCGPGSPSSFAVLANTYLATKSEQFFRSPKTLKFAWFIHVLSNFILISRYVKSRESKRCSPLEHGINQ